MAKNVKKMKSGVKTKPLAPKAKKAGAATSKKAEPAKKKADKKPDKVIAQKNNKDSAKPSAKGALNWIKEKVLSKANKAETESSSKTKPESPKQDTKTKKSNSDKAKNKSSKSNKRDDEMDEDLILSDDDMGGEEIPDLSDFDEDEMEPETTDDDSSVDSDSEINTEDSPLTVTGSASSDLEAILTDAEGRPYCKVRDCDQIASVDAYCRFHYLLLWKKIQIRRKILDDGKLERYVEELTARYPDKFLEMIKKDLRTEKDFLAAIAELEIDESANDNDFDDDNQVLDEVRGFGGGESSMSDDDDY